MAASVTTTAIDVQAVQAAAGRLHPVAVTTPLLEYPLLNDRVGGRVLIKPENLQRTGSFKIRGAYNRLAQLSADERARGVVAWSSGNHAQGVAEAARIEKVRAAIVMPKDAPQAKIAGVRRSGGEIIFYDRFSESREAIARALAAERGAVLVPSYDDPDIIAGQGTVGLELAQQSQEKGVTLDAVLICCGGGGLSAGIGIAMSEHSPDSLLYAVEPEDFDDHCRSLASGQREVNSADARSICDALLAESPGALTFPINQRLLTGALAVSDDEVRDAVRFAFRHLKMVVEPGGAVALAALLAGKIDASGRAVAIILSGGNVDAGLFSKILGG